MAKNKHLYNLKAFIMEPAQRISEVIPPIC